MSATELPLSAPTAAEGPPALLPLLARWQRRGLLALAVWLGLFVLWSLLAPISGSVVGFGQVKVEANRKTVSHRDGGIVARVLVREGEIVKQGQALIALEDARIDTTVDLLQAQLVAERLRKSRLEAEAALQPAWVPPPVAGAASAAVRGREAAARERSAFEARQRTLAGQLDAVRVQIADIATEVQAHQRNIVASTEAMQLLREETASNEALLKENFVNRARVLSLKRGVSEYESRIETSQAEMAKARQRQTELEGRLAALKLAYVQAATEELREVTNRVVDYEERLRAGRDAEGRQVVTAPVAGRLVDLRVNTVGSAVGPREPIVDIVPSDEPLVVETRIGADAVTEVRVGQVAEVRLLGARQRTSTTVPGRVVRVSADALVEQRSGVPFFAVLVAVPAEAVAAAGLPPLQAGMSTEVYVRTSERTALEFLMEPLTAGLRRSFREH